MNLKEKVIEGLRFCNDPETGICDGCPYLSAEKWSDDCQPLCVGVMETDALKLIKAYDSAWELLKETLGELIENNDGETKMVSTFLFNLMMIKEVDIEDIDTHKFPGWGHTVNAMKQAVALLKAHEPIKPILEDRTYKCGACKTITVGCINWAGNKVITEKYCRECGRKVKWDDDWSNNRFTQN